MPQPPSQAAAGAKKRKGHRLQSATVAEAETAAAPKGGKKQSGGKIKREDEAAAAAAERKDTRAADGKGARKKPQDGNSKPDSPGANAAAQQDPKQLSKRTRGQASPHDEAAQASSTAAAQPKKKGKAVKEDLAPEKMTAGARLRKGLPPTPPSRISPRMGLPEAASDAAAVDADFTEAPKAAAKPQGKAKAFAQTQGANKVKTDAEQPSSRRSSGRLK